MSSRNEWRRTIDDGGRRRTTCWPGRGSWNEGRTASEEPKVGFGWRGVPGGRCLRLQRRELVFVTGGKRLE